MSTIIDTLIVKLGLDSKDLDNKSSSAGKSLKSLDTGAASTEGSVKKLGASAKATATSVDTLARSVGTFLATLGGTLALRAFIEDTIASNAALDRLSKNLGVSVSDLSAWGNAVEELGGSAKGLQGTMMMLSQAQTDIRLTGQSELIPYFSALGVALFDVHGNARPVNDLLLDIADSAQFKGLDRTTANNLGKKMGIDQDTLNLLLQGRREVELTIKRQKEYNAVNKEQAEQAVKLQKSLVNLKQTFNALGRDLLQQATPAIERMLGVLTEFATWVTQNREFIKDLALILGTVAAGLTAISIASSPIALVIGGIVLLGAAIALLWQDYQTWKRGGDSLIDWEKWKPGIDAAKKGMEELKKIAVTAFEAIGIAAKVARDAVNGNWSQAKSDLASGTAKMNKLFGIAGPDEAHDKGATLLNKILKPHLKQGSGGPTSGSAQQIRKYFEDRGWSPEQASGIAANLIAESNGNPNAPGDHGLAYGVAQWHPDRQAAFKAYSGKDIRGSNLDDQLDFVNHELQRRGGKDLHAATTANQAAGIVSREYEGPKDKEGEARKRGALADQIFGIKGATSNAAIASGTPGGSSSSSTDNSTTVTTGPVTIVTQATDAPGIAKDFAKSFSYQYTAQATSGLK